MFNTWYTYYTISINFSLITGCLEMKRERHNLEECATKKRHYTISINYSLITDCLEMKRGNGTIWKNVLQKRDIIN